MREEDECSPTKRDHSSFDVVSIDTIPDAVVIAEGNTGRIVRANAAATELFRCDPGDLVGRLQAELHPTGQEDAYVEAFQRGLNNQRVNRLQSGDPLYIETADGSHVPVEITVQLLTSNDDEYLMGVFRESSAQLAREKQLKQTTNRLETLFDALPVPAALLNTDGNIERWNQAAEDVLGYTAEQAVGETYFLFTDDKEFTTLLERVVDGETVENYQTTLRGASGARVHVEIDVLPVFVDGTVSRIIGTAVDISDRRQREQQLDVLYRIIRHNLRNELNVTLGWSERLQTDNVDKTKAAEKIKGSSNRLLELSDQVVDIPRVIMENDDIASQTAISFVESLSEQLQMNEGISSADLKSSPTDGEVHKKAVRATSKLFDDLFTATDNARVRLTCDSFNSHILLSVASTVPLLDDDEQVLIKKGAETPLRHASGVETARSYLVIQAVGGSVEVTEGLSDAPATGLRIEIPRVDTAS